MVVSHIHSLSSTQITFIHSRQISVIITQTCVLDLLELLAHHHHPDRQSRRDRL
jgi:hypothetical protein